MNSRAPRFLMLVLVILFLTGCGLNSSPAPAVSPPTRAPARTPGAGWQDTTLPATWTPEPTSDAQNEVPSLSSGIGSSGQVTYIVQEGDSLGVIAERFGVTVSALAAANNIEQADHVEVGQLLVIP